VVAGKSIIYDEDALVALLKQQDKSAFEYLYQKYSAALFGVLIKSVINEDTANDLLQEVFVKIWKNIGSYQPEKGRLYTWMLNIARNTGIDYLRSKQSKKESKNQNMEDVVYNVEKENAVSLQVETIGIRSLVSALSDEQQLILEYVYFKGYTHEDASKALNMPLGTIKTRIRSAMIELRKEFREIRKE